MPFVIPCSSCSAPIAVAESPNPYAINCPTCNGAVLVPAVVGIISSPTGILEVSQRPTPPQPSKASSSVAYKILVPLGYVLFVLLPMLGTGYFLIQFAGSRNQEQTNKSAQSSEDANPSPKHKSEPETKKPPVFAFPERHYKEPSLPDIVPEEKNPIPIESKPPIPSRPIHETTPLAIAPPPREQIEVEQAIEIAPEPREIYWKLPLSGYTSAWQSVGAVDLRIAGLSIAKVPFIDAKGDITESEPLLVIIVEVRKNTPGKKRNLLTWTVSAINYAKVFDADSNELPPGKPMAGKKVNTGIPARQNIPDDGSIVRDVILFSIPPDNVGNLDLRLDGERCGEPKDIWFKIPSLAWKKK